MLQYSDANLSNIILFNFGNIYLKSMIVDKETAVKSPLLLGLINSNDNKENPTDLQMLNQIYRCWIKMEDKNVNEEMGKSKQNTTMKATSDTMNTWAFGKN